MLILYRSDLMSLLVQDKDLVVLQTEFCLYMLLRLWAFLKLHPHWIWESDPDQLQVTEFYHSRPGEYVYTYAVLQLLKSSPPTTQLNLSFQIIT